MRKLWADRARLNLNWGNPALKGYGAKTHLGFQDNRH